MIVPVPPPGSVFTIDTLPAHSGVEAVVQHTPALDLTLVRFRAVRNRRYRPPLRSAWSGTFKLESEPIALTWDAFEWPKEPWWRLVDPRYQRRSTVVLVVIWVCGLTLLLPRPYSEVLVGLVGVWSLWFCLQILFRHTP